MDVEGYKLIRIGKDGNLHPLFINRKQTIPIGVWLPAEDHKTPGFEHRLGWHATLTPSAPHLKMELSNGEKRVWVQVLLRDTKLYDRPESQGGTWVLAQEMKVLGFYETTALD